LATVVGALEELGYRVHWKVLDAGQFGCATTRKRIFIVGLRADLGAAPFEFPPPTVASARLVDVLLPDSETDGCVVRGHPVHVDAEAAARAEKSDGFGTIPVGRIGDRKPARQGYRSYSPYGQAVTFTRRGGGPGCESGLYLVNGRVRRLHPREMARCMGLPEAFRLPEAFGVARRLLGNSVAVPVVRAVIERIAALLQRPRLATMSATSAAITAARSRSYVVLDLFAGCGGFSRGFLMAGGFELLGACQWDEDHPDIARTYEANHPGTVTVNADITLPDTKDRICAAFRDRPCDVIIGGPPCGPFSRAGRRDPNDPRARLFEDYLALVGRLRPKIAVMENVPLLLTARNPAGGLVIDEIKAGFEKLGYAVEHRTLIAADYEVPQRRERLIIIASKLSVPIRWPSATHAEGGAGGKPAWRTTRDAVGDLEDAPEDRAWSHVFTRHTPKVAARYAATPIGGKGCVNYNEGFYRNPPDQPSVTIKTAARPLHYRHGRELTCREGARVQSFPDDFVFVGGKTAVGVMIGNAVPPLLGKAVATSLKLMLDEAAARTPPAAPATEPVVAPPVPEAPTTTSATPAPSAESATEACPRAHRLLTNGSSKKGPLVWAFSIAMPGGRCPFASSICSRLCYADVGKFPLNQKLYERNHEATKAPDFADRLRDEVVALAWRNSGRRISICAHEKGEFHSLDYLRAWGRVIRETRSFPSLSYFFYTRAWINPAFRAELEWIAAECRNVKINLSLDREMVAKRGLPARIGAGLLAYLAETDKDLPPPGVDVVFRNLRLLDHEPMERLGGALVCPNESGLYVAMDGDRPVLKGGKTTRARCQECRWCVDAGLDRWERIKGRHVGVPGAPVGAASAARPHHGISRVWVDAGRGDREPYGARTGRFWFTRRDCQALAAAAAQGRPTLP
jgi:DNA (cytosine-5)-methyltransferase 1